MIFIKVRNEPVLQVNDKTRIDISKTFIQSDADISTMEIDPNGSGTYYDVTSDQYLDWAYPSSGDITGDVRVTDSDTNVETKAFNISVLSAMEENLFSTDADIFPLESSIEDYIEKGRDSFIDKHREAQTLILDDLDSRQIWKDNKVRYTAADIIDIKDFKTWSKYLTLKIIFEDMSNDVDDVFSVKAEKYMRLAAKASERCVFRLDKNGDGEIEESEVYCNNIGRIKFV